MLCTLAVRPEWTNVAVADWCEVDSVFVDNVRAEVAALAAAKGQRSQSDRQIQKARGKPRGAGSRKADQAVGVAELLKQHPTWADEAVAGAAGCKKSLVTRIRKALGREGVIPSAAT